MRRSGWLNVRETGEPESKQRWCLLDNGVLWLYKRPGENAGREALPLHDAVVGDSDPPAPLTVAVRCRRSGRVLALTALTKEDFSAWMSVLDENIREWREKRRASVLNKQIMALVAENEKDGNKEPLKSSNNLLGENIMNLQFTTRRRSELPRPTSTPSDPANKVTVVKRLPLKQLVATANNKAPLRWSKLTEVIQSGLLGILSEEQVAMEELKFSALVEEFRFNAEMNVLLRLAIRAVSWPDSLPAFNRRCIVHSLTKVKRSSDQILRKAESHWSQRVTMQTTLFSLLGTDARVAGWSHAYTDYCMYLDELRDLLQRATQTRNNLKIQSSCYGLELALVPVQHLTTLRQLLQTIFEVLPPDSSEHSAARDTRDFLNEILDNCYQELTEQCGSEYVAEMDNILQFDLSAVTPGVPGPQLLYKKRDENSNSTLTSAEDDIMDEEEEEQIVRKMSKASRPSIFDGIKSAAQFLRRRTEDGIGFRETRTASLPAVIFNLPPRNNLLDDLSSEEEEEEEVCEEPLSSELLFAVPRYFCFEPLYQQYILSLAQELVDSTLGRIEEETGQKPDTKIKGCTRWAKHGRVVDCGVQDTLSEDKRSLMEAKFEVIVSEAAYLRSLRALESHFAHCPEFYDEEILPPVERHIFFAGVEAHRTSSERLLASLEKSWSESVLMEDVCSLLHRHMISAAAKVAATACLNQMLVAHVLQNLTNCIPEFARVLTNLEASVACGGFTLLSFLTLPLKRLGRIRILLEKISAIMARVPEVKIAERAACESGKEAVSRLIARGEAAARRSLSDTTLQELEHKLIFRRVPRLALSAEGRALVHRGTWRVLGRREDSRGGMRSKTMFPELQAFLLTDLLLLSAQDGDGHTVVDYCSCADLNLLTAGGGMDEPLPGFLEGDPKAKYALYISFKNHAGRTIELIVGCSGAADRERWLRAFNCQPIPPSPRPGARRTALVRALRPHVPRIPDEANLAVGDIIAISCNTGDGWLLGRSMLDGTGGWFPSSLTVQLTSGRKSVTFLVSDMETKSSRFSLA